MINLLVNGQKVALDIEAEMPLLWALRNEIGMVGTKYGCGAGPMRRLHGDDRWRGGALLLTPVSEAQARDHHHRGPWRKGT